MKDRTLRSRRVLPALALVLTLWSSGVAAQQAGGVRAVSLEEAIQLAQDQSDQVAIAQAGVMRAQGQKYQARSQYFPQLNGSFGYTRTLASEFSALSNSDTTTTTEPEPEKCNKFAPNPSLPLAERIDSLEAAVQCAANANPFAAFSNLPFGRTNQLNLGLTLSQSVFSGGRVGAQVATANASIAAAQIGLRSTLAQLVLDVTQAYYDAALTDRLLGIAEQTLTQADTTLKQTQLARKVGDKPEFELLRAQVTRDNQVPIVIQRRSDRDLAYMRLKQLLSMPVDQPVTLTTDLAEDKLLAPIAKFVAERGITADTSTSARAPVRQAAQNVNIQRNQVKIARAQRLPSVGISSSYGRVTYPTAFAIPSWSSFNTNWTVSVNLQLPIFTGGRIHGDQLVANANYMQAQAQLAQTVQLAALDTRSAVERLTAAQAAWAASTSTVGQAARAYQIAEVRYREGISTQVELSDSRILLQQAEANRALTARDLQVARVRMALLPDLPLSAGGSNAAAAGQSGSSSLQQQPQQPQQQQPQQPRQQTPQQGGAPNTIATSGSGTGAQ